MLRHAVVLVIACGSKPPTPEPLVAPTPPPAITPVAVDARAAARDDDDEADDDPAKPRVASYLYAAPDRPGVRRRYPTAVLLVSPRPGSQDDSEFSPPSYRFVPLVCSIGGAIATSVKCGEAMPPRATIRTPTGDLVVQRSTKPFHDEAGGQDYPPPFEPPCCSYNTCRGNTIPYTPAAGAKPRDHRTAFAVWPADADIGLEIAGDDPATAELPPIPRGLHVTQAFSRGTHRFAAINNRYSGVVTWNAGTGWVTSANTSAGPRGHVVLATTDLDHDGRLELVTYAIWANQHGIDVFTEADVKPIYGYSCGNI